MVRTEASLELVASLLMPADPAERGVLIEAGDWRADGARRAGDADIVVWGAGPSRGRLGTASALWSAVRREAAIGTLRARPPEGFVHAGVHRLAPLILRPGTLRGRLSEAISGGALVELQRARGVTRIVDRIALDAGAGRVTRGVRAGSGLGASVRVTRTDGTEMLLRFGASGGPGDPHLAAEGLRRLAAAGVPLVPRVLAQGRRDDISWSAESILPGVPSRVTPEVASAAARFLASLPVSGGPPDAHVRDLDAVRAAYPSRAADVDALAGRIEAEAGRLPGSLRHGDLWSGNLLTRRGSLTGVVDWDAWAPDGVPGADLMYLGVMDHARRSGRPSGVVWSQRPWRLPSIRAALGEYWSRLSLSPTNAQLEAIAIAGWAAQTGSTLRRTAQLASTARWFDRNIEPMLDRARG